MSARDETAKSCPDCRCPMKFIQRLKLSGYSGAEYQCLLCARTWVRLGKQLKVIDNSSRTRPRVPAQPPDVSRIRVLRLQRGVTQQVLAQELGCSIAAIGLWESGKHRPHPQMRAAIAKTFSVPVDDLGFVR